MKIQAVIFDFDGTINDSASMKRGGKRIIKIVKRNGHKIPKGILKIMRDAWGLEGKKIIEICFGLSLEEADKIYREWEKMDVSEFFPLIPDSKRILKELRSRGIKIFMLTSRNRENLIAVLNHFGLVELFDFIQARDDYSFTKPDPRAFYPALVKLSGMGICPEGCLYVGDTILDFKCSIAAGVKSVNVLTGPSSELDFLKAGQREENIIPSIADLPEWLEKHQDC